MFRGALRIGFLLAGSATMGTVAGAQVPGAPVLQNAFANPGLVIAANFAGGSGQSYYGAAAGWGLGGGKLMLSGGAGAEHGNNATRGAYGGRAAATVWSSFSGSLAAAAFAGVGGAPRTRSNGIVTNPATLQIPAGVSFGYRRAFGTTRGVSAYVSPMYRWARTSTDIETTTSSNFRVAVGLDIGLTASFGVTLGGEFGGNNGGGSGGLFGAALSFVPGR